MNSINPMLLHLSSTSHTGLLCIKPCITYVSVPQAHQTTSKQSRQQDIWFVVERIGSSSESAPPKPNVQVPWKSGCYHVETCSPRLNWLKSQQLTILQGDKNSFSISPLKLSVKVLFCTQ